MALFFLCSGIGLLFLGGEVGVKGIERFSTHLGLSKGFAGAILIGFGTSMPEFITGMQSAYQGIPALALGNIIGSNSANILLIGGVSLLLSSFIFKAARFFIDVMACLIFFLLIFFVALHGEAGWGVGIILLLGFGVYFFLQWRQKNTAERSEETLEVTRKEITIDIALMGAGLFALLIGAWLTVEGAVDLARIFKVNEALIGVSVVAIGTSLPELSASIAAARKGEGEIILGNILGSCVFNSALVLGAVLIISKIDFPRDFVFTDIAIMLGAGAFLLLLIGKDRIFHRWQGLILLVAYAGYIALISDRFFT